MTWFRPSGRGLATWRTLVACGVALGVVAPANAATVVMLRDGVKPSVVAERVGVKPAYLFNAIGGFVAELTPAQLARVQADPAVLFTFADDPLPGRRRVPPFTDDPLHRPTPIQGYVPQIQTRGIRRVGTLASPTAQIDGIDQRVHANIAVLDSGVQPNQPDLNVVGGYDCTVPGSAERNVQPRYWNDDEGHGTLVAGIAGALDNGFGVVGVAPGARLHAIKVLDSTLYATAAMVLCGVDWVAAHADKIDVANMSLAGPGADDGNCGLTDHDPLHLAICRTVARGVTFVAGAGNDAIDIVGVGPAVYSEVIAVSGLSDSDGLPGGLGPDLCGLPDDVFAFFSNFGQAIDIAAPSVCITSTFIGSNLAVDDGTSYAAPFVTGAAALIRARQPNASPASVRAQIIANREQTALPGDPDGVDEGVLNVARF
jgi:subtilisin family serine protease